MATDRTAQGSVAGEADRAIAKDLQVSESCLRRWIDQAEVDAARKEGLSSDERAELVKIRREKRVLKMEVEILKRASASFARENVLPQWGSGSSANSPPSGSPWR